MYIFLVIVRNIFMLSDVYAITGSLITKNKFILILIINSIFSLKIYSCTNFENILMLIIICLYLQWS